MYVVFVGAVMNEADEQIELLFAIVDEGVGSE